jgi:hypothetical protein
MTANIEGARQAEAPGAMIWRAPGGPPQPRPASRHRDAILIVILLAAAARSARLAEAASAQIARIPDGPLPSRPVSPQRAAILIVAALAAEADLAAVAMVAIVLAAIRGLVRDSQVIPDVLTWYLGPAPAWVIRRRNRRRLRRQMLDAPARLGIFMPAGNPIGRDARTSDCRSQMHLDELWSPGAEGRDGADTSARMGAGPEPVNLFGTSGSVNAGCGVLL